VRLFLPGSTTVVSTLPATTDVNGKFSATGIRPGDYDIEVKEARRVGRIARAVTLVVGVNTRAFGDLLAGGVNRVDAASLVGLLADAGQLRQMCRRPWLSAGSGFHRGWLRRTPGFSQALSELRRYRSAERSLNGFQRWRTRCRRYGEIWVDRVRASRESVWFRESSYRPVVMNDLALLDGDFEFANRSRLEYHGEDSMVCRFTKWPLDLASGESQG
jgi:hypothetical protein